VAYSHRRENESVPESDDETKSLVNKLLDATRNPVGSSSLFHEKPADSPPSRYESASSVEPAAGQDASRPVALCVVVVIVLATAAVLLMS